MKLILGLVVIACVCSNGYAWSAEGDLKWWQTGIIYQIYPRSFMDSNGDGVGDLKGITSKLSHLKDIGVIAVWLSPIYPSPQVDAGYDISDFKNIHHEYGTLDDFEALQKKAKELGLKVVLDLVPNHSSDKHPWFIASENGDPKYKDYYIWRDGKNGRVPNNWLSNFRGSAWQWSDKRKQYYYHAFAVQQPDLNYENPAVVDEMKDVIRFWLKRGVDGFRIDAVPFLFEDKNLRDEKRSYTTNDPLDFNYLVHDLTQNDNKTYDMIMQWRAVLEEFGPDKVMMAEVYAPFNKTMEYFGTRQRPGAHFPFNFFPITELNRTSDPQQWKTVIDKWMGAMTDIRWPNWVMGNHDNRRIAGRFGLDLADGVNMISLSLPGTAMTYNGEEICMDDTFIPWSRVQDPISKNNRERYAEVGRDPERSPMQWDDSTSAGFSKNSSTWLPVNPNYWKLNVAAQKSADRSPLKMYKDIVEARKQETMKRGDYRTVVDGNVLIVVRTLKNKPTFVTAVNLGDEDAVFTVKDIPDVFVWTTSMNAGNIAKSSKVSWPLRLRPKAGVLLSDLKNAATRLSFGMAAAAAAILGAYILGRRY